MRGRGQAHPIWLPPLDRPASLGDLLPGLAVDPGRGFGQRSATVPLGELDRPRLQRRDRLEVDLTAGHLGVAGAPGSGRTTLLRTAVAGLALTRTPTEVALCLLDLRGGLAPLAGLPHVAAVAGREEAELAGRIIDGLARGTERPTVLVVDDWGVLRREMPEVEEAVAGIVGHGRSPGVRLLVAAGRWAELRTSVRDALGTRVELRLGDPLDSEVDRRLAAAVPRGRPGRGVADGAPFLGALPRLGHDHGHGTDPDRADSALTDIVERIAQHWHGPVPHRVRPLPDLVPLDSVPDDGRVRLGIRAGDHALHPLPDQGHLIVLGDAGSGRTGLLRTLLREIGRTTPTAQVLVVDPRGTLRGEVPAAQLLAHLRGDPGSGIAELADQLRRRLAGGIEGGPDVWVVADDADLVEGDPWQPLTPLLARAADVGLRVVVARRTGGAARALYEPLLGTLRDLRTPGVLLSGGPEEGPLLAGVRAREAPPGRGVWVDPTGVTETFQCLWGAPLSFDRSK